MQLLIVHREEEIGRALLEMVREYTSHAVEFRSSEQAAQEWAAQGGGCDLLITQLESESVDGFSQAVSLGGIFPHLHTCFLPAYPRSAQRLELPQTKIFPGPIEGEKLLQGIERSAAAPATPDFFPRRRFIADGLLEREKRRRSAHRRE